MLARHAVLIPHPASSPLDIPILELTAPHPVKNNSPHFMRLREPILQPLSFQIHAGMAVRYPLLDVGVTSFKTKVFLSPCSSRSADSPTQRQSQNSFSISRLRTPWHSFALICTHQKLNSFHFKQFRTLLQKHRGWGCISSFLGSVTRHSSLATVIHPSVVSFHPVNILLDEVECRVLGSLIEKETTTPEYYPLSLNALVNACNQKSNRDPVMNLDEAAVRQALHSLDGQSLVRSVSASDSRVTKYEHRLQEAFNFYRHETAILCVLLLRGPQTPGELRTRTERMHPFDDLSAVQSSLQHLMKREPPLAKVLPRQPGTKESRYAHLLSGDVEVFEPKQEVEEGAITSSADSERIALLEKEVVALRNNVGDFQKEIADLRQQFAQFKKQFE
jgi:uncharacterized protein YceH (UPF0502 family)